MKTLHIAVVDKIATYQQRDGEIVCGNSDYVIEFAFDGEWDEHTDKVARFIIGNHYENVSFSGNTCPVPIITNTTSISVGVYAGNLCTTTPAIIGCKKSILCDSAAEGQNPILNGDSAYIRYSSYSDGTDFTEEWSAGQGYIGFATGQTAPTEKEGYKWALFTQGTADAELSETSENPIQNRAVAEALKNISVDITVDSELSLDSENPVQNKVVTQEFKAFNEAIGDTNRRVSALEQGGVGGGGEYEIPTFNLVELGLPTIAVGGEAVMLETDTTEIMAALGKGAVKFTIGLNVGAEAQADVIMNSVDAQGEYICSYTLDLGAPLILTLMFMEGGIVGYLGQIASGSGGGVSSWNDLADKPFGEEADGTVKQLDNKYLEPFEGISEQDLLPSVVSQTFLSDLGVYAISSKTTEEMFRKWQEGIEGNVFVEFDGVVYECAPQRLAAMDNGMAVGNCTAFGGTSNGEPFAVTLMPETKVDGVVTGAYYWAVAVLTDTAPTEHTVRVFQPLGEPKYMLKESCLPFNAIAAYIDSYIDEALGGDY